jgi:hypothetical protein
VLLDAQGRIVAQKIGPFRGDELATWVDAAR